MEAEEITITALERTSTSKADAAVVSNFGSLLLQKIKHTSVANATRRKIGAQARVITSEEYKDHIEKVTALKGKEKMPVVQRKIPQELCSY